MIKKWNQFNESMAEKPGPNVPGSVSITISDDELNSFSDNSVLSKLIYDDKVSLIGNNVWYLEGDMTTKGVMDQYLEIPGEVELEKFTENNSDDNWIDWYDWDNIDELYIVYNCVSEDVEKVDATYFRDNFLEDDWEKVGTLEVAETCEISTGITDYIITRVK